MREVERRLKEKYYKRNEAHLRPSASTIQAFKTKHLNLKGKVLEDVKSHAQLAQRLVKIREQKEDVEETSAYQEAIAQIAEEELDTRRELTKVFAIVESRISNLYERVSSNEDYVSKDTEKLLQGYLDQFMKAIEQHKKYIEGHNETVDHNINITVMNDQVTILREAIRETLAEVEPDMAIQFMDKLNNKMRNLVYQQGGASAAFLDSALGVKYDN